MRLELSPRQALRWLPYICGLLGLHLLLLVMLSRVVGALQTPLFVEALLALPIIFGAQQAVSRYARSAWMRGYATGHWDGLEDANRDQEYF
jgi:hypothetical protein